MVEYSDVDERREALARLIGIEDKIWVQVEGHDRVFAIADEDLERADETKTSSVHFLRFELTSAMISKLKSGLGLSMGIDHPNYQVAVTVQEVTRDSLIQDLD